MAALDVGLWTQLFSLNQPALLAAVDRQCPVEDSVTYFLYETPYGTEAMALSDYNHLRRILDLEEAELGPGEYLVHCDTWNFWEEIQQSLAQAPMLSLAGQRLTPGTPFSADRTHGAVSNGGGNGGMPLWCRTRWHRACRRRAGGW